MKKWIACILFFAIMLTILFIGGCTIRNRHYVRDLIAAMKSDDEARFDELLKKAKHYDIDSYDSGWFTRFMQSGNYTALQYACQFGYDQYAEKLLKAGADPNSYSKSTASRPVLICALTGDSKEKYELVKMLLDYGADANFVSENGETFALETAAFASNITNLVERLIIAKLLIEYGARKDVTFRYEDEDITVYEYAIREEKMAYYGWTLEDVEFLKP